MSPKAFVEKAYASFSKAKTSTIPSLNVKKAATIADLSIKCPQGKSLTGATLPAFTGNVKSAIDVNMQGTLILGVAAHGTMVPPKVDAIGIYASALLDI